MPQDNLSSRLFLNWQPQLWFAVAVVSLIAAIGIVQLNFEDDPQNLYRQENQDFAELERLQDEFGSFDDELLVLVTSDDLFSYNVSVK